MRLITRMRRCSRGDTGMSLLEVIIAMAIFAVGVSAVLGLFVNAGDVTGDNIRRTTAANLVNKTLEVARAQTALEITNGKTVTTQRVGGLTYTITQNASFLTSNAIASVCQSTGSSLAYKLVRVSVTWPGMGNVKPVTGDVLRAIGVGTINSDTGTLAVLISGATGLPVAGVTVTLSGGTSTQTTGDDGCVVFTGLAEGTYSVTASQTGYVGTANTMTAQSASLSVSIGAVSRSTLLYDTERTLNFAFDSPAGGYLLPAGLPIRIGDTYLDETTVSATCSAASTSACLTGTPGAIQHLFPESYVVKAGSCTETDPSQGLIDIRRATANNSTVTVPMAAVTVKVQKTGGSPVAGRTVSFIHAAGTGCTSGETYTTPSVSGGSTVLLPYGTWTLSVPAFSLVGIPLANATAVVTVNSGARTANVTLQVTN